MCSSEIIGFHWILADEWQFILRGWPLYLNSAQIKKKVQQLIFETIQVLKNYNLLNQVNIYS